MARANPERRMPLREHLLEARNRLILSLVGIGAGAVGGWFLFEPAFEFLTAPVVEIARESGGEVSINFAGVVTALDMRVKMAVFLGVVVSSPWWLYQVWAFVAPGLRSREKRHAAGFLAAAVPLFAAGVALGGWVLPHAVRILIGFLPEGTTNFNDAQLYLSFCMRLILAFGIALVFPVVMVALTWTGVVPPRTWLKGWRWAVLLVFVFAAVMTPTPDALTMILMALPMCALYFAAIGIGALRGRAQRKAAA